MSCIVKSRLIKLFMAASTIKKFFRLVDFVLITLVSKIPDSAIKDLPGSTLN